MSKKSENNIEGMDDTDHSDEIKNEYLPSKGDVSIEELQPALESIHGQLGESEISWHELAERVNSLNLRSDELQKNFLELVKKLHELESGKPMSTPSSDHESRLRRIEQFILKLPAPTKVPGKWSSVDEFMSDESNQLFIEDYCKENNFDINNLGHSEKKEIYRSKITER